MHANRRRALVAMLSAIAILAALPSAAGGPEVDSGHGATRSGQIVGVIVKLQEDPVVTSADVASADVPSANAAGSRVAQGKRFHRANPAVKSRRAQLAGRHAAFESALRNAVPAAQVTHRYDVILGGLAMRIPEDQIPKVAQLPGVIAIGLDRRLPRHTDTSPQFIGASVLWGSLQGFERAGEDVLVGILDTGVWPEHPSFADPDPSGKPYPALALPSGAIACDFGSGANPGPAFTCNNKLIGAYRLLASYDLCAAEGGCTPDYFTSARDSEGHGTHVASTAAGNAKVESSIFGIDRRQVSGVAPRARIIAYKVCGPDTCWGSDSLAAIQEAILDGVDVINFSIGGGADPYNDFVELAFLDAYRAGIFVATSAGNSGPDANTVEHRGPWVTTVAASTEARSFQTTVTVVGSDGARLRLEGASITPALATPRPVVIADDDVYCTGSTALDVAGAVVVCRRGVIGRQQKSYKLAQAGAAGMLLYNALESEELETDNHSIPSVHIPKPGFDALAAFLRSHSPATASFPQSVARNAPGDVMTRFSSRGGTDSALGVSKPDLTAPGVQILAAQTPNTILPDDPKGQSFQAIAGTSMSSPHVAGAAALLRNLHPDWTPGQIKSALMTTAWTRGLAREDGITPFTPFDAGSGRVSLQAALSPVLTFDVPASDYVDRADDLWNANYPSVYVSDLAPDQLTLRRTARSTSSIATRWNLSVTGNQVPGMTVTVEPSTFEVPPGGTASFEIRIDKAGVPAGQARHAILELATPGGTLRMPVTAAGAVARPDLVITVLQVIPTSTPNAPRTVATVKNVGTAAAGAFYVQFYVSKDARVSVDDVPYWYCNVGSLGVGGEHVCSGTFAIPSTVAPGNCFLVVKADDGLEVNESNEGNNASSVALTVVAP